jgi:hypothetical protein
VSKDKPKAVIYDINKTLTKKDVAKQARKDSKKGKKILVVTSRPSEQRKSAEKFLKDNNIPADKLLMRPKGNNKKDSKVKKEIYEKDIKGKYKVKKAYDDKGSNVKMFRKEGLKAKNID